MADSGRLDELQRKFEEHPSRYFAPLANELRKAGKVDRAIELCRAYLPHQPGHLSGYIVYGQALVDADRADEARAIFHQALRIDPENIIALRQLGDIARTQGNVALARQWYEKVQELDPRNDEIARHLASLDTSETPAYVPPAPPDSTHEEQAPADAMDGAQEGSLDQTAPVEDPVAEEPVAESVTPEAPEPETPTAAADESDVEQVNAAAAPDLADTPEPVAEQAFEPEAAPVAEPFVTETMAELYLQQGLAHEALLVYRKLAYQTGDARLYDAVEQLEQQIERQATSEVPEVSTEREAEPSEESSPEETPILDVQQTEATSTDVLSFETSEESFAETAPELARESVRAFFARIGTRRPHDVAVSVQRDGVVPSDPAGLGAVFPGAMVDPADVSAATTIAGAFAPRL